MIKQLLTNEAKQLDITGLSRLDPQTAQTLSELTRIASKLIFPDLLIIQAINKRQVEPGSVAASPRESRELRENNCTSREKHTSLDA